MFDPYNLDLLPYLAFRLTLAAAVIATALLVWTGLRMLLLRLLARHRDEVEWGETLVRSLDAPLGLLAVLLLVQQAGAALLAAPGQQELPWLEAMTTRIPNVAIVTALAWWVMRIINRLKTLQDAIERDSDRMQVRLMGLRILRVGTLAVATLVLLDAFGIPISGILAFGGVSGIVIGLATKDVIGNFFSGMILFWEQPFRVGDWIRVPSVDAEGNVKHIGWRCTELETFDRRPLYIPNQILADSVVENPQRMKNRRIFEYAGVRYDDIAKLPDILKDIRVMLDDHKDLDSAQAMMANFDRYGESTLDFFVSAYTQAMTRPQYQMIKEDVLFKIHEIVTKHGADFAFPTRTLHHADPTLAAKATRKK